ncbi:hypothetical protein [Levilactobacillus yiduensis]|uniref:hypothetical protein n=1 Tax=Levilactobacillus yiduensis TaxID=2953880 RepID=UPI000EF2C0E8|nr:hypothetical protein [Levilactobacillus yiduensis]AYM02957.1 hypothetical protein D8911_08115 [Levilactobacillus brevis]
MKAEVWAAVCGAVRDELDVRLMLDYLLRCRAAGTIQGIVFSTWEGELEKVPAIAALLKTNNVTVVRTPPIDGVVGNIKTNAVNYWRQATQLQRALDVIPADAIVLKTRTDRAMPATRRLVAMLATEDPLPLVETVKQQLDLPAFPAVFRHQVAAFRPRTNRVFQFTDFAFMGYSQDLRKMLNFEVAEFYFSRYLNANMLFFIVAFVRDYPIITDYERRIKYEALIPELERYTAAGGKQFPAFLQRFYAVYLGILATHFRLGSLWPQGLGKVDLPIAFADFFHDSHHHHLRGSNLGTLINSAEIVDAFITQSYRQLDQTTQTVLATLHHADAATFERATPTEVAELTAYQKNADFSRQPWLLDGQVNQVVQAGSYVQTMAYQFPGISQQEQVALWQACAEASSTNRVLLDFWVTHQILPSDSAAYLASGAKDGESLSILTMMRLLRQGYLDENDAAEILRVNNTQAKLKRQHRGGNIQVTCYVLNRVLYLQAKGEKIPRELDKQVDYYFRRYMTGQVSDEIKKALYQRPEQLAKLFDRQIAHAIAIKKPVVHRRLIELALELTGQRKYWELLQPLFTDKDTLVQGVYTYAVANGLLIRE